MGLLLILMAGFAGSRLVGLNCPTEPIRAELEDVILLECYANAFFYAFTLTRAR